MVTCENCETAKATCIFDGEKLCGECKVITQEVIAAHPELSEPVECLTCGNSVCEDALCKHDREAYQIPDAMNVEREDEDERTVFDMYDDAEALASAGWGIDEDYGCYGGED